MKATRGQANAAVVQEAVRARLDEVVRTDEPVNVVLWVGGVVLIAIGYQPMPRPVVALPGAQGAGRERRPLRGLAWRRPRRPARPGASVAMQILRRQARIGAGIAVAGFVLVFLGFLIK